MVNLERCGEAHVYGNVEQSARSPNRDAFRFLNGHMVADGVRL